MFNHIVEMQQNSDVASVSDAFSCAADSGSLKAYSVFC